MLCRLLVLGNYRNPAAPCIHWSSPHVWVWECGTAIPWHLASNRNGSGQSTRPFIRHQDSCLAIAAQLEVFLVLLCSLLLEIPEPANTSAISVLLIGSTIAIIVFGIGGVTLEFYSEVLVDYLPESCRCLLGSTQPSHQVELTEHTEEGGVEMGDIFSSMDACDHQANETVSIDNPLHQEAEAESS